MTMHALGPILPLTLALAAGTLRADIRHVPAEFATIQDAIDASVNGDEVHVAPGVYAESLDLLGKRLRLKGSGADTCVLDGATLGQPILFAWNGESAETVVEGFTFTNGRGLNVAPQPCAFASIHAAGGGAIVIAFGSSLTVRDCDFINNAVDHGARAGAVVVSGGGVRLERCLFSGNGGFTSDFDLRAVWGGALHVCTEIGSIEVLDCIFDSNGPTDFGTGAIIMANVPVTIDNCVFSNNVSSFGGGLFLNMFGGGDPRAAITNCTFESNEAGFGGGALLAANGLGAGNGPPANPPTIVVRACTFIGNQAEGQQNTGVYQTLCNRDGGDGVGGPGQFYGAALDARTLNADFGQPIIDIANCLIADSSSGQGGRTAMYVAPCLGGQTYISNTTFVNNDRLGLLVRENLPQPGSGYVPLPTLVDIRNCILWGNGAALITPRQITANIDPAPEHTFHVQHSLVQDGWAGEGNVDADPRFVAAGDYRLLAGSPAIDAGDNAARGAEAPEDLAGNVRRVDDPGTPDSGSGAAPLVDIGAFEFGGVSCRADLSGSSDPNDPAYGAPDGLVDAADFFYYLDRFVAGDLLVADLTSSSDPGSPGYGQPDGAVDAADFFYFLDTFVLGCS